ncbi:DEAD/DEAH box helicase family protein [Tritrichomonas foetus]|uniref:DEAD/DEAH box helicase family protein n=1 Tax=Tritrichomonas foetus TaxID=1144522 RepID=A0A1J4JTT2_9EUKA|nr:DEAD/DEAH box helicase family protein [Tritrichomonas foetus]|eukprot:OHT02162.1 DEAD/DEAH box helicase family protein [Tritrichomonas foetus]
MLLPDPELFKEIDTPSSDVSYLPSPIKPRSNIQMNELNIPLFLQESYMLGRPPPEITTLRPWQIELFQKQEWKERRNCLILVPTAGGKTVAAEVAIAQLLQSNSDARVLYCLPFVSLAAEKFSDFTHRFSNYSVRPFYANIGTSEFANGSIAICTFEKAHTLINAAIRNKYIDKFQLVVIDEIHMLGDSHRGATVEALVAKMKLLPNPPQIIGLSATINADDANIYGKWLNGYVYSCADRPSLIQQYVVFPDGHMSRISHGNVTKPFRKVESIPEDKNHFLPLIADALANSSDTVLIFVNSRRETREYAKMIATYLYSDEFSRITSIVKIKQPPPHTMQMRQDLLVKINNTRFCNDSQMAFCLLNGVAFHNAGLLIEERKFIEDALRNGVINVIVATTTLSAGINITNVNMIIIKNVFRREAGETIPLTGAQYNQMAGRAGRTSKKAGKVIILQQSMDEKETLLIKELSKYNIGHITGHLLERQDFDRFYLQCMTFFNSEETYHFPGMTYEASAKDIKQFSLDSLRDDAIDRLIENRLIINEEKVTKLGMAIAGANFGIDEGLQVYETMKNAQLNICLSDELHLLFLVIPTDIGFKTPPYNEQVWTTLFNEHDHVINEMLKLTSEELEKRVTLSYIRGGIKNCDEIDRILDKIYSAAILLDVVNEKSIAEVEKTFNVDRGTIQSLQTNVSTFAGQVVKFCELCSFQVLGAAINKFRKRLDYAVKNELLPLMSLPSCSQNMARLLFNQGIETPSDLVNCDTSEIVPILMNSIQKSDNMNGKIQKAKQNESLIEMEMLINKVKKEAIQTIDNQRKMEEFAESMNQMRMNHFM